RIAAQARERQPREILLRPEVGRDRTGQPADPQALPQLTDGARNGIIDRQSHGSLWRPAEHPAHTPAAAANRSAAALCAISQAASAETPAHATARAEPRTAGDLATARGDRAGRRLAYRQPSAGATWVRMLSMTWAL